MSRPEIAVLANAVWLVAILLIYAANSVCRQREDRPPNKSSLSLLDVIGRHERGKRTRMYR
jgi:hypothetical protein